MVPAVILDGFHSLWNIVFFSRLLPIGVTQQCEAAKNDGIEGERLPRKAHRRDLVLVVCCMESSAEYIDPSSEPYDIYPIAEHSLHYLSRFFPVDKKQQVTGTWSIGGAVRCSTLVR